MDMLNASISQILLFVHLLVFAFAIVAVLREDFALLNGEKIDVARLTALKRSVAWMLAALWITGLSLIALDTGFDLDALAEMPKLAIKLTIVSLLSVNGALLHWMVLPMLCSVPRRPDRVATVCVLSGAISTVTWLFASFVGVSRLIAPAMSYGAFLSLYAAILLVGIGVALSIVRPRLKRLLLAAAVEPV